MSFITSKEIAKVYLGSFEIYSSGSTVTYVVDGDTKYTEEFDSDTDVLVPNTFIPIKSGWEFLGWRKDTAANASIETSLTMKDDPIVLYAIFKQEVTCKFISGLSKATSKDSKGNRYYNGSGVVSNATIKVPSGANVSGWEFRGYAGSGKQGATESVAFNKDDTISNVASNRTYYGLYQQDITLSYNGNGSTGGSTTPETKKRYHNSAGNYSNPEFTLKANGFTRPGYSFNGWDLGAVNSKIKLDASKTANAKWTDMSYYAIQNGAVVNCPNIAAGTVGCYANGTGTTTNGSHTFYGAWGHNGSPDENYDYEECVVDTGSMVTSGCRYMSVQTFLYTWGYDAWAPYITIWGDSTQIKQEYAANDGNSQTWTIDVSSYSTVRVRCRANCRVADEGEDGPDVWMNAGIENLRFYN